MTDRKITFALKKIQTSIEQGYLLEALIRSYLLNVDLIRFILTVCSPELELSDKKVKVLVKVFIQEVGAHPEMKSIIRKQSLKSIQPWLVKMDHFFKQIKMGRHVNPGPLQAESEKIFGLLKISANKLLLKKR